MSAAVIIFAVTMAVVLSVLLGFFAIGFRAGGQHWQSELQRARFESARAERELHDLTRQAFVAMSDHAERHRQS